MELPRPAHPWLLVLAYTGFLGFIPLLAAREHREVQLHARKGLALFAALAALGVAATVVSVLVPRLGCVYVDMCSEQRANCFAIPGLNRLAQCGRAQERTAC